MDSNLYIYNTLSRTKEKFEPLHPPLVGLYVCGPTVYSDVHLGNCRTFVMFDLIYRYLLHLGYKVRYVRNITDAGHLEGDMDEGDDKFAKKARLEQLEPMEIVQKYTLGFHDVMRLFNALPPGIEPTATGHIIEQIEMVKQILKNGYAYEVNGTVYFDVEKYCKEFNYTILTNRQLDDLLENTRELGGQNEKRGRLDFALWIKAKPEHIMQWPSPWGTGFPGWHIECSAMSSKYLGNSFDIHGGGMDLAATHHTNEIAQSQACNHVQPAKYWMHTNMLTVNGTRMSKTKGNGFLPHELFTGSHALLTRGYSPMSVRFFMLQAHYRSTLDFSNEALEASDKGFKRLINAYGLLEKLNPSQKSDIDLKSLTERCYAAMNDDFNSPVLIAELFEAVHIINSVYDGKTAASAADIEALKKLMDDFVIGVLGLKEESNQSDDMGKLLDFIINLRSEAKVNKDYATSDKIRIGLNSIGIQLKDNKEGTTWNKI
ncbi:MAG: cysteine--tRNA ligase [Sphingobacteriales bacterium 17-39-43]|mgnify:FL=1|uniref:cysteine--tRNA ligase n=1 Tax=Daejeonella sp. TaxID=2805397 RepID=UPI000BCCDAEB|nr:cysteine--tRNA ligase [Daejeonella sp.]OYX96874.1 MAG: cysteine--tRNA ligase [Sphingobacteriia bacterium 35-40-5]OYZ29208.1 MAG: cysteine--tRNA ligase [Sphingobacteriales bacterium 16-39-50]OYZ58387.1 MAG: cysteine--tRNA ligase [Sphingobacteriales bacterium 24-40-4]OZA22388.1 MAG: cysteine--tRNA ligase [Sphingobacteriales bacterium 17-39-43]HQS05158.1 cysteine--tRNA ligase [Daejeonella sp.]